jgi:outer membrane protein assembly factor BamB
MFLPIRSLAIAFTITVTITIKGGSSTGSWPQWRGPNSSAIAENSNVPLEWSSTTNLLWKSPVPGRGHSSPVVSGDRVFITTSVEGEVIPGAQAPKHFIEGEEFRHPESTGAERAHTFKVLCYSAARGERLWEQTVHDGRVYDDHHRKSAYASPTCAIDVEGGRVISYFGSEGLFCHDLDGKLLWKTLLGPISTLGMGTGTSPVVYDGSVILQCDQKDGEGSFLQAWDIGTGRSRWRTERKVSASWCTPIVAGANDKPVLLSSGMEHIIAYDPATGKEVWQAAGLTNNAIPSPVVSGNVALFSAGYPARRAIALDVVSGNLLWEYRRGTAYVPSPIAVDDLFYLVTDSGLITCLEARTGTPVYEGERLPHPAKFTASPIAVQGRILLVSEDGQTFVIRTGREFAVESVNRLDEEMMASPAVAGGRLYLRGEHHLFCISG